MPDIRRELHALGFRAPRGGIVSHNTVTRALARIGRPIVPAPRPVKYRMRENTRARFEATETFRTPAYSFLPLLDYRPDWFTGCGFDPSAGDGRMIREIIRRGNPGPHFVNDIREEEADALADCGTVTIGDYLADPAPPSADFLITNPPFSKAVQFVEKARQHIAGPILILQSIGWQTTAKRSLWLRQAGLAHVLNLPRRPKWEVDSGVFKKTNVWDYAWFVFLPDHVGPPTMDWLIEG